MTRLEEWDTKALLDGLENSLPCMKIHIQAHIMGYTRGNDVIGKIIPTTDAIVKEIHTLIQCFVKLTIHNKIYLLAT